MLSMSITIRGSKETKAKLKRLGSSLYELKPEMADIGAKAAEYYSNQGFASQGGVFGARWAALSPRYAAIKAKLYPGRGMLVRTGKMQDSFTYAASNNQVIVGNSAPYFKYHQSTLPRSKMPRRASMGVNDPVRQMVRTIIEAGIRKKLRAK